MGKFCIGDVVIIDKQNDFSFRSNGYVGIITKMSSAGNFVRLENCNATPGHKQCLAHVSWLKPFHTDDSFEVQDLSTLY